MNIVNLVEIKDIDINIDDIFFSKKTATWCKLKYPNHLHGCPNYGKPNCPPNSPFFQSKITNYHSMKLIIAVFDLNQYVQSMKQIHPTWTLKQLRNVLYWQNQLKKLIKNYITQFKFDLLLSCGSGFNNTYSMEAVGIDVMKTLRELGYDIETKPEITVHLVSLIALRKNKNSLLKFIKGNDYK